jgi:mono/diheme cytochrome c family protein
MMKTIFSAPRLAAAAALALFLSATLHALTATCAGQSEAPGKDFDRYDKWKKHVSADERQRPNSLAADPQSAAAGAKLFSQSCARCHGNDAAGHRGKPSLRGPDVISSSDGEIFWILKNGDLPHNMPAFPQMPDAERWQIVTYLRSLPPLTTNSPKPSAGARGTAKGR